MNKEIVQECRKINSRDIWDRKFYPVWFFTNERINYFFPEIEKNPGIKRVFAAGGGGDFALALLATRNLNIEELNVCDVRPMACITIDFKICLLKNLSYAEFLNLFGKKDLFSKTQVYHRIAGTITPLSREIIGSIIENCKKDDFLKCVRKSGLWYRDSFWQIKNRKEYLPYLVAEENYRFLQNNLDKITIFCGDFEDNLKLFPGNYYDLIYASNILDAKEYCPEPEKYLKTIREKLNAGGLLLVVTQNNPKKMVKQIEGQGFYIHQRQVHRFNIISSILGHYDYSFLLFRKSDLE
jgi:SAM-dependent methyltransferase